MPGAREGMRQVADACTQTAPPPATPAGARPWGAARSGTAEEQKQMQGQAAMYGVNAAVATARSSGATGEPLCSQRVNLPDQQFHMSEQALDHSSVLHQSRTLC